MTYQTYTHGEIRPGDECRRKDGCDHCGWTPVNFSVGKRAEDYLELVFRRAVEEPSLPGDADWLRRLVELCGEECSEYAGVWNFYFAIKNHMEKRGKA